MTGLPGSIFGDSNEERLGRGKIFERLNYLDEKIENGLPIQKELECQAIKLRLLRLLSELIRAQITSMEKHKRGGTLQQACCESTKSSDPDSSTWWWFRL